MRTARTVIAAFALALALAACDKATDEECEAACLHYGMLGFAEEQELSLGSDELEQAWSEMRDTEDLQHGLGHCIRMCRGQASSGQIECVKEATTLAEADDCSGVSRARSPDDDDVD